MPDKMLFNVLVIIHVLAAIGVGVLLYAPPAHDSNTYTMLVRIIIFPLLGLTGATLYVYPRLKKVSQSRASA